MNHQKNEIRNNIRKTKPPNYYKSFGSLMLNLYSYFIADKAQSHSNTVRNIIANVLNYLLP